MGKVRMIRRVGGIFGLALYGCAIFFISRVSPSEFWGLFVLAWPVTLLPLGGCLWLIFEEPKTKGEREADARYWEAEWKRRGPFELY